MYLQRVCFIVTIARVEEDVLDESIPLRIRRLGLEMFLEYMETTISSDSDSRRTLVIVASPVGDSP